ncbi:hypothetical protein ABL78_4312 [Leptomonas seymouri]|uniref:Uncharacterized protein n=1 Tax=Leptomonas seymouri TaxID=5684 RepID=A0A0N1I3Q7_LEPSE|nr:hypothetical protein ABL78_4312 [Leptomonas seymouri]|eukprot:KPI86634.1 hypothetical protein ABL78_4312 [Leptomonas seymouri]
MWQEEDTGPQKLRRLIEAGNYAEAEETVQYQQLCRQADLSGALEALAKDAANQWSFLQRAKAQSRVQEQSKALSAERAHLKRLLEAQNVRYKRSGAALVRFSEKGKEKLDSTPLNIPWEVLVLRDQEARFALQGNFAAAAESRRDAARAEHKHACASFAERYKILDRHVSRYSASLVAKESSAQEKDEFDMTTLQRKHAAGQQQVAMQVQHLEDGMLAAQRRTQQKIIMEQRTGGVSRATTSAAHRGAALEKRVYGDAYTVPSLCECYGPLLE